MFKGLVKGLGPVEHRFKSSDGRSIKVFQRLIERSGLVELWGFVEAKKRILVVVRQLRKGVQRATYHAFHFSHLFHFPFLEWLIEGMRLGKHACHVHDFTDVPATDGLIERRAVFEHLRMVWKE